MNMDKVQELVQACVDGGVSCPSPGVIAKLRQESQQLQALYTELPPSLQVEAAPIINGLALFLDFSQLHIGCVFTELESLIIGSEGHDGRSRA